MYIVRVVENHGHNGDDVWTESYEDYDEAYNYILNFYFDGIEALMDDAEEDVDEWYCDESDATITIEIV